MGAQRFPDPLRECVLFTEPLHDLQPIPHLPRPHRFVPTLTPDSQGWGGEE